MKQINIQYYKKDGFNMIMGSYNGKLCLLDFADRIKRETIDKRLQIALSAKYVECDDKVLRETKKELDEYLQGKRKIFSIPLLIIGSDFQKSVWEVLLKTSYGKTISYKEQAKYLGNEKAVRAVANANGANAIAIIIPCHRIIGSNGTLTGYAGGLEVKKRLLEIENNNL